MCGLLTHSHDVISVNVFAADVAFDGLKYCPVC